MPVLYVHSVLPSPPDGLFDAVGQVVSERFGIPFEKVWVLWIPTSPRLMHRPSLDSQTDTGPVVVMYCRRNYPAWRVSSVLLDLKTLFANVLQCSEESVFVLVQRVSTGELLSFGLVWNSEMARRPAIEMDPIGFVHSSVRRPSDDCWGDVEASIALDERVFSSESLSGLDTFSHVDIVFLCDLVEPSDVLTGARHPRDRQDWPSVGVFAQRVKNRPNRIAVTTCAITRVEGTRLFVSELDAVDGTPVLDIKPHMKQFGPRTSVRQPAWSTELMNGYFNRLGNG